MKKILVSAYACEPDSGSEPGVGWNWVKAIAVNNKVWVITRKNNKDKITQYIKKNNYSILKNIRWIYYDLPPWLSFWKKGRKGIHLYYYLWQIGILFIAKKLHKKERFQIVHHVTFVNYWLPSFLFLLNIPFVWGPVGGADSVPNVFLKNLPLKIKLYEYIRRLAQRIGESDPFVKMAARKSSLAIATTKETAKKLKKIGAKNIKLFSQVILSEEELSKLITIPMRSDKPFRFISIGQIIHFKGFDLGIKAFALFYQKNQQINAEYWVVGSGSGENELKFLAKKLGIEDKVRFWGWLKHEDVIKKIAECDVLIHPSLRESGGWVIVEAMSAARSVISLDLGGPSILITKDTGIKIRAISPNYVIEKLAFHMLQFYMDDKLKKKYGNLARKLVLRKYNEKHLIKEIERIYTFKDNNEKI